eukprot:evm.model.scf_3196.1 EVM.evm.TU.scf_3196.1   scf_3196:7903-12257(-)
MALTCGICFDEGVADVGMLDCCEHTFCFNCISRWMEEESRCPFCKEEVKRLTRKRLASSSRINVPKDSCTGARLNKRRGKVVEKVEIREKRQVVETDPADVEAMQEWDSMVCAECADGDDEELLILCDEAVHYLEDQLEDVVQLQDMVHRLQAPLNAMQRRRNLRRQRARARAAGRERQRRAGTQTRRRRLTRTLLQRNPRQSAEAVHSAGACTEAV